MVDENPTFRQYYGIDVAPGSTYEETRRAVLDATGWSFEEECQWAETDKNGDLIPGTDTEERLQTWLNSHLDDSDLLEKWGAREAGEYAPGFELMHCLPLEDVKRLGLREGDLGGRLRGFRACQRASASELNAVISAHALPFLVVDEEGSEEY